MSQSARLARIVASGGLHLQQKGLYAGTEWRCLSPTSGWIVAIGNARMSTFSAFCDMWRTARATFDEADATLTLRTPERTFCLRAIRELLNDSKPATFENRSVIPCVSIGDAPLHPWTNLTVASDLL